MSIIKPFRALRPTAEKAKQVSCVPYDVALESEVREMISLHPDSFLRITRPEADFAERGQTADEVLQKANKNLQRLIDNRILITEAEPSLYVYRLSGNSHTQTGIVGCCSLDEYDQGLIKKHERTRPDKVKDRTRHMLALRAQTGLIFLAYRGPAFVRELIARETFGTPLYDFEGANNVRHTVWRVGRVSELIEAFQDVPAIYVADGHHRIESAARARDALKARNHTHTGTEDYNYVLACIFPAEELRILPYNRVVRDLDGLTNREFLARVAENFIVTPNGKREPDSHGEICMYLDQTWYSLRFAVDYVREPDPVERLDVTILQDYILRPILGISDPSTNTAIGFVGGIRGSAELQKLVDEGSAAAAFSLFHTTIDDLIAVSDAGEIMPPKSTWFEPKLKDGLFVHRI